MESRTRGRTRLPWTLGAAVLAHAVAWASMGHVESRSAAEVRPKTRPELELDLDAVAVVGEDAVLPSSPRAARSELTKVEHARAGAAVAPGPTPVSSSAVREAAPSDGSWTFSPTGAASVPDAGARAERALDGVIRAGVAATLAQNEAENHSRRAVIPAFTPREIELGLAAGGVLVSLGRDVVRRSRVPDESRARLQFDTDAMGVVVACRVLDATSGWPEWDEATREIMTASHAKPPMRVPTGARGLSITLDVSCDLRTVDGDTGRGLFDRVTHARVLRTTAARLVDVEVL